ncbi:MAG: TIGR03792 family protein [Cyanobacteria bacterium P01_F01_bin.150]
MVIEWLQFRVNEDAREEFVERDRAIWTTALAKYPGFEKKDVWISPEDPNEVICVVYWETMDQWKSIPVSDLEAIETEFQETMGNRYKLLDVKTYNSMLELSVAAILETAE